MNVNNPLGSDPEVEVGRNITTDGDLKASGEELAALLRRVSDASIQEVETLINQLQKLRTQLQNTSNRIQRDIAEHTELSRQTMQLTSIIVDSVRNFPPGTPR